jgi:sugar phosphate isomerase/epimerase
MERVSRRDLLRLVPTAAAASWVAESTLLAQAPFPPALGVQLYTLRKQLGPNADDTLRTLAEIGYREVETTADSLGVVAPLLKKHGLAAPSGHFNYADIAAPGASDAFTRSLAQARELGLRYYVIAYLMPDQRKRLDQYRAIADRLNEAARRVKEAGLQFAYHHHSFEFEPLPGDGGKSERGWDVFLSRLDKDLVAFEVDVFWIATAGLDPAKTIRDLGSRVKLLHLKDRAKEAPQTFNEGEVPPDAFREAGNGSLDFPSILKAAREVNAQGFFVEQDQTPGDPADSLRQSFEYLRRVKT